MSAWTLKRYEQAERWLLAAVAAAVVATAALHLGSPVAQDLRAARPIRCLILPETAGPTVLAQWEPRPRLLKILPLPPGMTIETLFGAQGGLPVSHWLRADLPSGGPGPEGFILSLSAEVERDWLLQPKAFLRLPALALRLRRSGRTDLALYDLLLLALDVLRSEELAPAIAAGREVRGRFEPSPGGLEGLQTFFLGGATPATQTPPTAEVLNASGEAGAALEATQWLRRMGVDVMAFANADPHQRRTLILDRSGRREEALRVRRALGLRARVLTEPDPSRLAQVSVLVGDDFKTARESAPHGPRL